MHHCNNPLCRHCHPTRHWWATKGATAIVVGILVAGLVLLHLAANKAKGEVAYLQGRLAVSEGVVRELETDKELLTAQVDKLMLEVDRLEHLPPVIKIEYRDRYRACRVVPIFGREAQFSGVGR